MPASKTLKPRRCKLCGTEATMTAAQLQAHWLSHYEWKIPESK